MSLESMLKIDSWRERIGNIKKKTKMIKKKKEDEEEGGERRKKGTRSGRLLDMV